MYPVLLCTALSLFSADFSICTTIDRQINPQAIFAHNQYYLFWEDRRFTGVDSTAAIYGARVSSTGTVLDPDGKLLLRDSTVEPQVASDGTNFLVVAREGNC